VFPEEENVIIPAEMLRFSSSIGKLVFSEEENDIFPEDMLSFFKLNGEFNCPRRNADFFKLCKETGVI
jgi:hypothetical protein